jgi:hypothetical protein
MGARMKMIAVVGLIALALSGCSSLLGANSHGLFVNTNSANAKFTTIGYRLGIPL